VLINYVKPNITREQAVAKFRGGFSELRHGRLRVAVDFYIPYRLFRISWNDRRSSADTFLAADSVTGKLDLIRFDEPPAEDHRSGVDTTMFAVERINEEEACRLVREKMMRSVFMKGFFKLSGVNVGIELATSLHIPYWVGVYERQGNAHLEIINALQGRFEGAKLREIVAGWFQPQQT